VIATDQLSQRKARVPDIARENAATLELIRELSLAPECFFQKLDQAALHLSQAGSTGISLHGLQLGLMPALHALDDVV
jgi:hypothetical protein